MWPLCNFMTTIQSVIGLFCIMALLCSTVGTKLKYKPVWVLLTKNPATKEELRYNGWLHLNNYETNLSSLFGDTTGCLQKDESRTTQNKVKDCHFHRNKSFQFPLLWLKTNEMAKLYNPATKFIWRFRVWLQFWMVVWCCRCSLNPFRMQIFLFSLFCGFQA